MEQHCSISEGLVVAGQRCLVVAEALESPHQADAQPVMTAILIQDLCAALATENGDPLGRDSDFAELGADGWQVQLGAQQPRT
jgi:hypothetical protein